MSRLRRLVRFVLASAGGRRMLGGLALATSCLLAVAVRASEDAAPRLNWWARDQHSPPVGWFMVDFVALVLLLYRIFRKPVREAFAQRHVTIKQAIADAERAHGEAKRRYEEYRTKLANADEEAARFIKQAREDGALERDQIVRDAGAYAERLRSDMRAIGEQEVSKSRQRLQHALAAQLVARVEAVLHRQLDDTAHASLIEQALAEIEQHGIPARQAQQSPALSRPSAGGAV